MQISSNPMVATPNYQKMRELCDIALDTPNGIRIPFTLKNYGTLEECAASARRFQQLFSSFRARARGSRQTSAGFSKVMVSGEQITSEYDKLACMKMKRPDGVDMCILPAVAFEIAHEVLDAVTGEPIAATTPEQRRMSRYIAMIFEESERQRVTKQRAPSPLTVEQELDFLDIDRTVCGELYESMRWKLKSTGLPFGVEPTLPEADFDIVDTPMDQFGVGPDESA